MDMINRDDWGARDPRGGYATVRRTKGVKVHYTGSRENPAMADDHDLCMARVRSVQRGHMDGNGWIDVGYSLLVCGHRVVFEGRGLHRVPAANGAGLNSDHYAVLGLVGSSGLVVPSDGMLLGILDAIAYLREEGGAGREIKGHRDGYSTSCPGEHLYAWVKRGAPRPSAAPADPNAWSGRLLRYVKGEPLLRGQDVRTWQAAMVELGYDLEADGLYGNRSALACYSVQAKKRILPVDGIVGPKTWAATVHADQP